MRLHLKFLKMFFSHKKHFFYLIRSWKALNTQYSTVNNFKLIIITIISCSKRVPHLATGIKRRTHKLTFMKLKNKLARRLLYQMPILMKLCQFWQLRCWNPFIDVSQLITIFMGSILFVELIKTKLPTNHRANLKLK